MKPTPPYSKRYLSGLALMEVLVVVAIIIALAAVVVPIANVIRTRNNKVATMKLMQDLGSATMNYCAQHDDQFPGEDVPGPTTWAAAADPKNADVWFNALPKQLGRKGAGDYAGNAAGFYASDSLLHVPGASYPTNDSRLVKPLFAIAFNRKLERRTENPEKTVRKAEVTNPARTVLFAEEGLPKETRTVVTQPHYNGEAKGSAKSFVGRYGGKGWMVFCDGHTELVDPNDTLDVTGQTLTPQTNFIWTTKPEADPNHPDHPPDHPEQH